jgi:hypothetical protein
MLLPLREWGKLYENQLVRDSSFYDWFPNVVFGVAIQ